LVPAFNGRPQWVTGGATAYFRVPLKGVSPVKFPRLADAWVVNEDSTQTDFVMSQCSDAVTAQTIHHKPTIHHTVAIKHDARAKERAHAISGNEEGPVIVVPKMIVAHENKGIWVQAKVQIHR
jgi:hypothetical protein